MIGYIILKNLVARIAVMKVILLHIRQTTL